MMKHQMLFLIATTVVIAGCSKPTAEEYFAQGENAEKEALKMTDTVREQSAIIAAFKPALGAFENVVAEYPKHELAEAALFRIANIRNNNTHEPQLAIDAYKLYIQLYPDGKQTPLAMFLVGYLYNNDLHNLDSAAAAYRRFLAKYPDNEMALSAQFELNTLGKSPEDLLPKQPEPQTPSPKKLAKRGNV